MSRTRLATIAVLPVLVLARPAAQQEVGELDLLLDKLGRYLESYEAQLAGVVADERYEQQQIDVDPPQSDGQRKRHRSQARLRDDVPARLGRAAMARRARRPPRRRPAGAIERHAPRRPGPEPRSKRRRAEDVAKIMTASSAHNLGGVAHDQPADDAARDPARRSAPALHLQGARPRQDRRRRPPHGSTSRNSTSRR